MSIRFRFLLLLLVIALVPMAVVVVHDQVTARRMAENLMGEARVALTKRLTEQLAHGVDFAAVVLRQQKELVELALTLQAREAARRLAAPEPPGDLAEPLYTAEAFDRLGDALAAKDAPVVRLAPGLALDDVGPQAVRLGPLVHALRGLRGGRDSVVLRQHVALDSGVTLTYPGRGGFGADEDGRTRPWYRAAIARGGLVWNPPAREAASGRLVSVASTPVRGMDGHVVGVAAVEVDMLGLLSALQARDTLPADAALLLVDPAAGGTGLRVLARAGSDGGEWTTGAAATPLAMPDGFADALAAGEHAVMRTAFEGADVLLAHAPVDAFDTRLLLVLPASGIDDETANARTIIEDATTLQIALTGAFALFMVIVVVVLAVVGARVVTRPVRQLDAAARRLAAGDWEARVEVTGGGELARLARGFNAMVPRLRDQVALRQSLSVAAEVHEHLLPETAPDLPGFDIAGASLACDETGGDYFDYLALPGGRLGIAVGDVTGHGIPAALLMATARGLLRARADRAPSTADLLDGVNRQLAVDTLAGRFMTLFYLVLTPGSRHVAWANAGHAEALVVDPGTGTVSALAGGGVPLGIDADQRYEELTGPALPDGAVVLIATDGLWEARDEAGEMFGRDRLEAVLREHADESAETLRDALLGAVNAFQGAAPLADDATLVVVRAA